MKFKLVKFNLKPAKYRGLECLNCGQPLRGHENYCSYCGQKNTTKKLSFGVFVNNMVSGIFSYDSRFWRTFIPLLTKPGKVSRDYIIGKRVHFVNPFQLYLNVSIVFFIILGFTNRFTSLDNSNGFITITDSSKDSLIQEGTQQIDTLVNAVRDDLKANLPPGTNIDQGIDEVNNMIGFIGSQAKPKDTIQKPHVYHIEKDTVGKIGLFKRLNDFDQFYKRHKNFSKEQALDSLGYEPTYWNKFYYQQTKRGNENLAQLQKDKGAALLKAMMSHIPISLFIFLPVFTLFLKLLYIRRKFTYMEHLVFVFHTQTVFFLLLIIFFLLNFAFDLENVSWVFILLFLLYLYKALRRFYQQGRIKTIIKFLLLNNYYMFLAGVGIVIVAMISIFFS